MDASGYVRALREGLEDQADDVLALWRQRSGSEASQKKALCEAMIRCEDEWEYGRARRSREALRNIRRQLEGELYS